MSYVVKICTAIGYVILRYVRTLCVWIVIVFAVFSVGSFFMYPYQWDLISPYDNPEQIAVRIGNPDTYYNMDVSPVWRRRFLFIVWEMETQGTMSTMMGHVRITSSISFPFVPDLVYRIQDKAHMWNPSSNHQLPEYPAPDKVRNKSSMK